MYGGWDLVYDANVDEITVGWELVVDDWDNQHVAGRFTTPELGIAAWPFGEWHQQEGYSYYLNYTYVDGETDLNCARKARLYSISISNTVNEHSLEDAQDPYVRTPDGRYCRESEV